jgi:hypothetical protein
MKNGEVRAAIVDLYLGTIAQSFISAIGLSVTIGSQFEFSIDAN